MYSRRFVVIALPTLLWVAAVVCAGIDLYYMFEFKRSGTISSANTIQPYLHVLFALSLTVNTLTTGKSRSRTSVENPLMASSRTHSILYLVHAKTVVECHHEGAEGGWHPQLIPRHQDFHRVRPPLYLIGGRLPCYGTDGHELELRCIGRREFKIEVDWTSLLHH